MDLLCLVSRSSVLEHHGGTVAKFIGDAAMTWRRELLDRARFCQACSAPIHDEGDSRDEVLTGHDLIVAGFRSLNVRYPNPIQRPYNAKRRWNIQPLGNVEARPTKGEHARVRRSDRKKSEQERH